MATSQMMLCLHEALQQKGGRNQYQKLSDSVEILGEKEAWSKVMVHSIFASLML